MKWFIKTKLTKFKNLITRIKKNIFDNFISLNFKEKLLTKRWIKGSCYFLFLFFGFLFLFLIILTIIIYILVQGLPYIKWNFLWTNYNPNDLQHSGVAPFVVSTLLIIVVTIIIAFPVSLFTAMYLNSPYRSIFKKVLNFLMLLLNSIPSLVIGMVGLVLFVEVLRLGYVGFSIVSGAFTLCFVVLPTLTFGFLESFRTVSKDTIFNCYALGANIHQVNFKMILPLSKNGILSTIILTINRIIGESAPLLLTMGGAYFLPNNIFDQGRTLTTAVYILFQESRDPYAIHFAYAMIIIILFIIVMLNFIAKQIIKEMDKYNKKYGFLKTCCKRVYKYFLNIIPLKKVKIKITKQNQQ